MIQRMCWDQQIVVEEIILVIRKKIANLKWMGRTLVFKTTGWNSDMHMNSGYSEPKTESDETLTCTINATLFHV